MRYLYALNKRLFDENLCLAFNFRCLCSFRWIKCQFFPLQFLFWFSCRDSFDWRKINLQVFQIRNLKKQKRRRIKTNLKKKSVKRNAGQVLIIIAHWISIDWSIREIISKKEKEKKLKLVIVVSWLPFCCYCCCCCGFFWWNWKK